MPLLRHERAALIFLLRHMLFGIVGALLFGFLVLYFDIGHLRSLSAESSDGWMTVLLLFFGLMITFGGLAMGIGVMSLGQDDN
jgi:hypothetical protein